MLEIFFFTSVLHLFLRMATLKGDVFFFQKTVELVFI